MRCYFITPEELEKIYLANQFGKSFGLPVVAATLAMIAVFVVVAVKGRKKKTA